MAYYIKIINTDTYETEETRGPYPGEIKAHKLALAMNIQFDSKYVAVVVDEVTE